MRQEQWPPSHTVTQPFWWSLPPLPGRPAALEALVEGEVVETSHGPFFRRRTAYSLDTTYGGCRLGDFLGLQAQTAAALARAPELGQVTLERMLFLDTETTGLAGGTGTYVFLVGLGYFLPAEPDGPARPSAAASPGGTGDPAGGASMVGASMRFVLDQCLMRSYSEERAMLSWVAEHLEGFEALTTFNGRSFDIPLLQTRVLLSRLRLDFEEWPHFDLLHTARRLWRPAIGSCALQSLERHILGVGREDDVESFLIPAIYHQFLRDGDGRYLKKVFAHNEADVLAMVAVAIRACLAFDCGTGQGRDGHAQLSAAEYVGLGRVYEQLGNLEAAEGAYRAALAGRLPAELRARTLLTLAALLKRTRRHDEAAALWELLAGEGGDVPAHAVTALVELAKYWEHRRRDPLRAHALTTQAMQRWLASRRSVERPLPGLGRWRRAAPEPVAPDDFARRLARLERKRG
ncbi:MAG TPA: ribonuclease H-like domain-containing protein [Chloroflexota bacterium]|nr:ribonuclease H-like domain-containing protein [Chloroflexota bacterium]